MERITNYLNTVFGGGGNQGLQVGSNLGTINNLTFPPLVGDNVKPPSPYHNIPFRRDPDFVARESILDQIDKKCTLPSSLTALVGLGGVGKSQLAIEYGYRVREQCPDTWVFWVFAGSPARFEEDYKDIADLVQIPRHNDPQTDKFKLVRNWLRDGRNGTWLVIIDNADDAQISLKSEGSSQETQAPGSRGQTSQPLSWLFPQTENGRVLMTTRYRDIAEKLVEYPDIIPVDPMDESDALELLKKYLGGLTDPHSERNGRDLVAALDCMPLAIAQAAAFISHAGPRWSISRYHKHFQKSDSKRSELLDQEGGQPRRDLNVSSKILTTWLISFEHLRKVRRSAADRLSLMSFFDRQNIPGELLGAQDAEGKSASDSTSEDSVDIDLENDIVTLRGYSFISESIGGSFGMHALVQLATRNWLAREGKLEVFKWHFFKVLARAWPAELVDYDKMKQYRLLFPHAKAALLQSPEAAVLSNEAQALEEFATLMHNAGVYAVTFTMKPSDGESLARTAMKIRRQMLGMEHPDTLSTMRLLGTVYRHQRRFGEAEDLGMKIVGKSRNALGWKHRSTMDSISFLLKAHLDRGKFAEAAYLCDLVYNEMEPPFPSQIINHIISLAKGYRQQGNNEEALCLLLKIGVADDDLGLDHSKTLSCKEELAAVLHDLNRPDLAIEVQMQIIRFCERKHGAEHLETLTSRHRLCGHWYQQGQIDKGLEESMQLLAVVTELHDYDALRCSITFHIVLFLTRLRRFDEAEKTMSQLLEFKESVLGPDDPGSLRMMSTVAYTLLKDDHAIKAKKVVLQLFEAQGRVGNREDPETLQLMYWLTESLLQQGHTIEAKEIVLKTLKIQERVFGPEDPKTIHRMYCTAAALLEESQIIDAKLIVLRIFKILERVTGPEDPKTIYLIGDIAFALFQQDQTIEAKVIVSIIPEVLERVTCPEDPQSLELMCWLVAALLEHGYTIEAKRIASKISKIQERMMSPENPEGLLLMCNFATHLLRQGQTIEAKRIVSLLLEKCKKGLGPEHPITMLTVNLLFPIQEDQPQEIGAEDIKFQRLSNLTKAYGIEDTDTSAIRSRLADDEEDP